MQCIMNLHEFCGNSYDLCRCSAADCKFVCVFFDVA